MALRVPAILQIGGEVRHALRTDTQVIIGQSVHHRHLERGKTVKKVRWYHDIWGEYKYKQIEIYSADIADYGRFLQ